MRLLDEDEVEHYRRFGFVVVRRPIPLDEFTPIKNAVEKVIESNKGGPDLIRQLHIPKREGHEEGWQGGEEVFRASLTPSIVDTFEQILGPDIAWAFTNSIAKPAANGRRVPWHQDAQYSHVNFKPNNVALMWIALDDVGIDNGCVRYVKDENISALLRHERKEEGNITTNSEVVPGLFDEAKAVDAILKPGQFSIHAPFVVHGSNPNVSGRRRAGYSMSCMPTTTLYDRGGNVDSATREIAGAKTASRPIWCVRGEIREPRSDYLSGHEGLEELDRIAKRFRTAAGKRSLEPAM